MPLNDAINFIKNAGSDKALRQSLYTVKTEEIFPSLESKGYKFTPAEFEESINLLHVKCQTEDEANHLFEVVNWFKMLCS